MKIKEAWRRSRNVLVLLAYAFCLFVVLHVFTECASHL